MKLAIANVARARYINEIMAYFAAKGEDVAQIASNACNMPFVEDGEEGVLEIVAKVVKKDYDECMQEREDYKVKCVEAEEKKAERAKAAAEKKAKTEAKRKVAEETAATVLARAKAKAEAKAKKGE